MRNRAIAVLAREHGIALSHVSLFLFIDRKTAWAFPIFACEKRRSHYRRVIRMAKPAQSGNDMKKLNYSCVPTALFLLECEIHTLCQAKKPLIAA